MASSSPMVGEFRVQVYLYDLSQGMARALSQQFLGKQIDGIWHTGIVVFGHEYFCQTTNYPIATLAAPDWINGGGIQATLPGQTMAGRPSQVIEMGFTRIAPDTFHEFLTQVSHRFTAATYSLLEHNCNNFTNEACLFLTGKPIPAYITGLPAEALATPFGSMLRPMIEQMEGQMRQGGGGGGGIIGQPWGGAALSLPRGLASRAPDRMVPEASNPSVPHSAIESAAALAVQAINQSTPVSPPVAAAAAASSSSPTPSAAQLVSILKRSGPAKPLTSSDKKAKSFQVLVKSNAKKAGAAPLSAEEEATLTELVTALSADTGAAQVQTAGCALIDKLVQQWPTALQFPVLGILRLMVLRPECATFYTEHSEALTKRLLSFLPNDESDAAQAERAPAPAQAMALCTLANLLVHPSLASKLSASPSVWSCCRGCSSSDNATVRLMGATLVYNLTSVLPKDESDTNIECVTFLAAAVPGEAASEVCARLLLALTEVTHGNDSVANLLVGLDFLDSLRQVQTKFASDAQIQLTATELSTILTAAQQAAFGVE